MSYGDRHTHDSYDVHGVASENHRHYDLERDLESKINGLREDLNRAFELIRELEDQTAAVRQP